MANIVNISENPKIQIFNNEQFGQIRVATTESGEPLFCLADLCRALNLSNPTVVAQKLDEDECPKLDIGLKNGQYVNFVTEPGMYTVILRSDSPAAKPMQKWVTSEVLPSIRKRGGYMTAHADEAPDEIMARALIIAQDTITRTSERLRMVEQQNELHKEQLQLQAPEVLFADSFKATQTLMTMNDLAKYLNQKGIDTGEHRLYDWMVNNHYLIRNRRWSSSKQGYVNDYMPTQRAIELKVFYVIPRPIPTNPGEPPIIKHTVKVTGKGVLYFTKKFLNIKTA